MQEDNLSPIEEISAADLLAETIANSQEIQNEVGE